MLSIGHGNQCVKFLSSFGVIFGFAARASRYLEDMQAHRTAIMRVRQVLSLFLLFWTPARTICWWFADLFWGISDLSGLLYGVTKLKGFVNFFKEVATRKVEHDLFKNVSKWKAFCEKRKFKRLNMASMIRYGKKCFIHLHPLIWIIKPFLILKLFWQNFCHKKASLPEPFLSLIRATSFRKKSGFEIAALFHRHQSSRDLLQKRGLGAFYCIVV